VMDHENAQAVLRLVGGMRNVVAAEEIIPKNGRARVRLDFSGNDEDLSKLSSDLFRGEIAMLGFNEEEKDLEHMFMRVTRGLVT